MNSGHVTERVCVHVCASGSWKGDFVLVELLTLVASRNITVTTVLTRISANFLSSCTFLS